MPTTEMKFNPKAGYAKFWKDYHIAYAEPFHSYVAAIFAEESDVSAQ